MPARLADTPALKTAVAGSCPACGAEDLSRYPVVAEIGWELVTKCQTCLHSVAREPWKRLGPIELLVDRLGG